jgi:hypothetical protein
MERKGARYETRGLSSRTNTSSDKWKADRSRSAAPSYGERYRSAAPSYGERSRSAPPPERKKEKSITHNSPTYGIRSRSDPPSEKWKTEKARSKAASSSLTGERPNPSTSSYRARMEESRSSPPPFKQQPRHTTPYKPSGSSSYNKFTGSSSSKPSGYLNNSKTTRKQSTRTHSLSTRRSRSAPPPKPVVQRVRRNAENFPLESRLIVPDAPRPQSSFNGLLGSEMSEALTGAFGVCKPTQIQSLAIPLILGEEGPKGDILIAAETGSGKTIAYLTPVMQALRDQEGRESFGVRKVFRPRAVIVVPTRELVSQVTRVAKSLSQFARLRVVGVDAGLTRADVLKKFGDKPVDLLVTSSGSLIKMMGIDKREKIPTTFDPMVKMIRQKSIGLTLTQCTHFVVDEADTMFGMERGFNFR